MTLEKVAVIGAGVMGSGIAAHFANAGATVTLLDLDVDLARAGLDRQLAGGGFMLPQFANRVQVAGIDTGAPQLAGADWIVEAVAERLDIKRSLYDRLDGLARPDAVISSNTSTIPLATLVEGMPEARASRFLITHFFNPPRRMRLLELVAGPQTAPSVVTAVEAFADVRLGKGVVHCNDTPGFICNRICAYWMFSALVEAVRLGIDIAAADAVLAAPFGIPKSGVFGLFDLIGLDVMAAIRDSLVAGLPATDPLHELAGHLGTLQTMLDQGLFGRKSGAGFYRQSPDRQSREALDLTSLLYRPMQAPLPGVASGGHMAPREALERQDQLGRFTRNVMLRTFAYAASLVLEIADTPRDIDRAMELGLGWQQGPFALMDRIGTEWLAAQLAEDRSVPLYLTYAAARGGFYVHPNAIASRPLPGSNDRALLSGSHATLMEDGEDIGLLELHGKSNALSPELVDAIQQALELSQRRFRALIIATQGAHFSVGADLKSFLENARAGRLELVASQLEAGQTLMRAIRSSSVPVVVAAAGFALGGGCEMLMHATTVVAHAELAAGLVETGVGLVPAWGGCTRLMDRLADQYDDPTEVAVVAFDRIFTAQRSDSAAHARVLGYFGPDGEIVMNIDRLLQRARQVASAMVADHRPVRPRQLRLSGRAGYASLEARLEASTTTGTHQRALGKALIQVLTGGRNVEPGTLVGEEWVMAQEREAFLGLLATSATQARIEHMLKTGKPLSN